MSRILCNAGPLIALGKLNRLDLLATLYPTVAIPGAVYTEVVTNGLRRGFADARLIERFWQQYKWPVVTVYPAMLDAYHPQAILDRGEIELLALAATEMPDLVLIDDEVARREARRLGLTVKGTLGVLVQGYHQKIIDYQQIELLVNEIAARPDIWISAQLCQQVLRAL